MANRYTLEQLEKLNIWDLTRTLSDDTDTVVSINLSKNDYIIVVPDPTDKRDYTSLFCGYSFQITKNQTPASWGDGAIYTWSGIADRFDEHHVFFYFPGTRDIIGQNDATDKLFEDNEGKYLYNIRLDYYDKPLDDLHCEHLMTSVKCGLDQEKKFSVTLGITKQYESLAVLETMAKKAKLKENYKDTIVANDKKLTERTTEGYNNELNWWIRLQKAKEACKPYEDELQAIRDSVSQGTSELEERINALNKQYESLEVEKILQEVS